LRFWRRAKLIIADLSTGERLVVQPRFTGGLLIDDGRLSPGDLDYSTLGLTLADGRRLHYRDVRRLGTVALMNSAVFARYERALGIEPLDRKFTAEQLSGIVRASRQAVKKLLMDQRRIAGVGNIYANEALWRAGIDPSRPARSLSPEETRRLRDELVASLTEAIAARGTTFRDFRDAGGNRGNYASQLRAYGRGGLPCRRCGTRLFETHAIDGRSTVICSRCQW
jgi:formamidopyrimidine-DNA glycosylase